MAVLLAATVIARKTLPPVMVAATALVGAKMTAGNVVVAKAASGITAAAAEPAANVVRVAAIVALVRAEMLAGRKRNLTPAAAVAAASVRARGAAQQEKTFPHTRIQPSSRGNRSCVNRAAPWHFGPIPWSTESPT